MTLTPEGRGRLEAHARDLRTSAAVSTSAELPEAFTKLADAIDAALADLSALEGALETIAAGYGRVPHDNADMAYGRAMVLEWAQNIARAVLNLQVGHD